MAEYRTREQVEAYLARILNPDRSFHLYEMEGGWLVQADTSSMDLDASLGMTSLVVDADTGVVFEYPSWSSHMIADDFGEAKRNRRRPAMRQVYPPVSIEDAPPAYEPVVFEPPSDAFCSELGFDALYGIPTWEERVELGPPWQAGRRLCIPVGFTEGRSTVELDVNSGVEGGMGHGLVAGRDKSGLLESIVLGLAITHSPRELNLVLVDIGCSGVFHAVSTLPHVVGVASGVIRDRSRIVSIGEILAEEAERRSDRIQNSSGFTSLGEYEAARAAGADLDPIPELIVVVDNLHEMPEGRNQLVDALLLLARVGRSLGIHLLFGTNRFGTRPEWIDSHASWRIASKVSSESESNALVGTAAAAHLPDEPGHAYLTAPGVEPIRFRAALASPSMPDGWPDQCAMWLTVAARAQLLPAGEILMPSMEWRVRDDGPRQREDGGPVDFDSLYDTDMGLYDLAHRWSPRGSDTLRRIPIGLGESGQPVGLDVNAVHGAAGACGYLLCADAAVRTAQMETILLGLAISHSPEILNFVFLDRGLVGTFDRLVGLPHVSAVVACVNENSLYVRAVADALYLEIERRHSVLQELGFADFTQYNNARISGQELTPMPELMIVGDVSGRRFEAVDPNMQDLITVLAHRDGPAAGIHVLWVGSEFAELPPATEGFRYRLDFAPASADAALSANGETPDERTLGHLKSPVADAVRYEAPIALRPRRLHRILLDLRYLGCNSEEPWQPYAITGAPAPLPSWPGYPDALLPWEPPADTAIRPWGD
ncbi:FtsK/SpoIIIE domain-containing protein [Nocardia vermiculata]|uniref:FtsK domain-containing protein n=1 Tax=Nocardia vermiculata TaxID=257274 RepID=A0A846XX67_9NOCA|nr:FtsK/SpoIIIE domain-containing protein [Nocardia vermiculata]NKY50532.1 hypothetical protein [Nocardia vermiculata]